MSKNFPLPAPPCGEKYCSALSCPQAKNTLNFSPDASRRWINIPLLVISYLRKSAARGSFSCSSEKNRGIFEEKNTFLINQDISIQEYWHQHAQTTIMVVLGHV